MQVRITEGNCDVITNAGRMARIVEGAGVFLFTPAFDRGFSEVLGQRNFTTAGCPRPATYKTRRGAEKAACRWLAVAALPETLRVERRAAEEGEGGCLWVSNGEVTVYVDLEHETVESHAAPLGELPEGEFCTDWYPADVMDAGWTSIAYGPVSTAVLAAARRGDFAGTFAECWA